MQNLSIKYLKKHPLLISYIQKGIVNLNALARYLKESEGQSYKSVSTSALSMDLRRGIRKYPKTKIATIDLAKYNLQLIIRTNIHEIILNKTSKNRENCLGIVNTISKTKYFVSMIEGEKEIVVITDSPINLSKESSELQSTITHLTEDLGFISINFPIELRKITGVYALVTSALTEANIPIHSFHTIGGEILILIKNEDITLSQEVLKSLTVN